MVAKRSDAPFRGKVEPAAETPCAQCPWRTANHGKRHPDGWYTKANLSRLWAQLRRGEAMTCHPTDPTNPLPPGARKVPETTTTRQCTGAIILQQRELMRLQRCESLTDYRRQRPRGLTVAGIGQLLERAVLGGVWPGTVAWPKPDLNQPVSHDPLGEWTPPEP